MVIKIPEIRFLYTSTKRMQICAHLIALSLLCVDP